MAASPSICFSRCFGVRSRWLAPKSWTNRWPLISGLTGLVARPLGKQRAHQPPRCNSENRGSSCLATLAVRSPLEVFQRTNTLCGEPRRHRTAQRKIRAISLQIIVEIGCYDALSKVVDISIPQRVLEVTVPHALVVGEMFRSTPPRRGDGLPLIIMNCREKWRSLREAMRYHRPRSSDGGPGPTQVVEININTPCANRAVALRTLGVRVH